MSIDEVAQLQEISSDKIMKRTANWADPEPEKLRVTGTVTYNKKWYDKITPIGALLIGVACLLLALLLSY